MRERRYYVTYGLPTACAIVSLNCLELTVCNNICVSVGTEVSLCQFRGNWMRYVVQAENYVDLNAGC